MRQRDTAILGAPARVSAVRRLAGRHARVRSTVEAMLGAGAAMLEVPTVSVALVDATHELIWVTSSPERHRAWTHPMERSLCAIVVVKGEDVAIADIREDAELRDADVDVDLLVSSRGVESYLGVPLVVDSGLCLGSVCAYGHGAVDWSEQQKLGLRRLSEAVALVVSPLAEGRDRDERRARGGIESDVRRLVDEHAALRRVATVAAHADGPQAVFEAVVNELSALLDGTPVVLAEDTRSGLVPRAASLGIPAEEQQAMCSAWAQAPGPVAACSAVLSDARVMGAPITLAGRPWGVLLTGWAPVNNANPVDPVQQFAELVAIALDNAERRRCD